MKYDLTGYRVKLAETDIERKGAQRLRYRVFVQEMGARVGELDRAAGFERDSFDERADHLILLHDGPSEVDPLDAVVGTYRLTRGDPAGTAADFYGASEFDLAPILASGRPCAELGRSCVAREHRGGAAMHLLWNGLAEYVLTRRIEIVFGVASFPGADPVPFAEALAFLHQRHLAPPDLRARAWPDRFIAMDRMSPEAVDPARALRSVPSLIRAYLRMGGGVGDGACVDRTFNTTDVFVAMDTARMEDRYRGLHALAGGIGI